MNPERGENGSSSSDGHGLKGRVAAISKKLDQVASAGSVGKDGRNPKVAGIAYQQLELQGHDLIVQRRRDGLARLLIKIRRGEAGYDLAKKFLYENKELPPPETEV